MKSIYVHLIDRSIRLLVSVGLLMGALGMPTIPVQANTISPAQSAAPGGRPTPTLTPVVAPTATPTAKSALIPPGLAKITARVNADQSESAAVSHTGAVVSFMQGRLQVVAEAEAFGEDVDLVL